MKKLSALILTIAILFTLVSCAKSSDAEKIDTDKDKTITIGASVTPHAEILAVARDVLAKDGYTLEIKEYNDYIIPNTATESGELDANYFQHQPYLDEFNKEKGTHLVAVSAIHYEPFGIYAGKSDDLKNIKDGAVIAVPNDSTNEGRALLLLEAQGLITLDSGVGFTATKLDIKENPKNLDIKEIESAQLARSLGDVDFAVINGNYAIEAELKVSEDALAVEDASSSAAQTYANVLVVKEGNEEKASVKALIKALESKEVREYIEKSYDGAVLPV